MDEAHLLIDANSSRVGFKRGQEPDAVAALIQEAAAGLGGFRHWTSQRG
jgi:hypothetical protein